MHDSNRELILKELISKRGHYLSGETISNRLGISRAAVAKQIKILRKQGYTISAVTNRGYCLENEPDLLDIKKLAAAGITYRQVVDSTNAECRQMAENGAPAFSTIVADEQSRGRGRLGRQWHSPPRSGLWFSILLKPISLTPAETAPITLVTAAIIAGHLNEIHHLPVTVKWPNDLLIRGKKTGGILTELKAEPDRIDYLVIGIGLNINQQHNHFPAELQGQATSLMLEGNCWFNRTDLLSELHFKLIRAYRQFLKHGFSDFHNLWLQHSSTIGKSATISWAGGTVSGKAIDLDKTGSLVLEDNQGTIHHISYGEIL